MWADAPGDELVLFAWAMRELYQLPVIDRSLLTIVDAGFDDGDLIQLAPTEMTVEDMMRIWDAVTPSYRLSAPFVARVVQIDVEHDEGRNVVAQRMRFTDEVPAFRVRSGRQVSVDLIRARTPHSNPPDARRLHSATSKLRSETTGVQAFSRIHDGSGHPSRVDCTLESTVPSCFAADAVASMHRHRPPRAAARARHRRLARSRP